MKLSAHFTLEELTASHTAVRKGIDNTPSPEVVLNLKMMLCPVLESIRGLFWAPVHISSAFRCNALNRVIGGADTSKHKDGLAADFNVEGFTPLQVAKKIAESDIEFDQLIFEGTWVHIGLSYEKPRRQCLMCTFPSGRATYTEVDFTKL